MSSSDLVNNITNAYLLFLGHEATWNIFIMFSCQLVAGIPPQNVLMPIYIHG